jgi:hypothetical protein
MIPELPPLTDDALAAACLSSYLPGHSQIEIGDDLSAEISDCRGGCVVAFRGTCNIVGWLRDFDALPVAHEGLGTCHAGFLRGASKLWNKLELPKTAETVILTGHSLGGALAVLVGALRVIAGERVDAIVTFGAPRAAYARVAEVLAPVAVRQYRRGEDPVPDVPFDLPAFPYKHAREPLVAVGKAAGIRWDDHSIRGYIDDVASFLAQAGGSHGS